MESKEVRRKFLEFYKAKEHAIIPSASLVPGGDVTTLFTGSGMQPMMPYLLGEPHPLGRRIADSQKSFRAEDIDEVGDNRHTTFFEMLGNWSFGDYWKEEQLSWVFEFLTKVVGLDPQRLYVTVFAGDEEAGVPKDEESPETWVRLFKSVGIDAKVVELMTEERGYKEGMQGGRIFYYGSKKNWWSRAGAPSKMPAREPGGPDSEMFYDFGALTSSGEARHDLKLGPECHPNCDCGRFMEIGNSVFMEYMKTEAGTFEKLKQRNVDFGGGLERIAAASSGDPDVFNIDILKPLIDAIRAAAKNSNIRSERIIADHVRAAVFLIADGVRPSNKERGYLLRRLIRRAVMHGHYLIGLPSGFLQKTIGTLIASYVGEYPELTTNQAEIQDVFAKEQEAFEKTYESGIKEFEKILSVGSTISGAAAFLLLSTYGFPIELTEELAGQKGRAVDRAEFENEMGKHRAVSRAGAEKKFGGHGLILDTGELKAGNEEDMKKVIRLHTATHLLQMALREVLGNDVHQMGSDVTPERTRFDFSFVRKMTPEEIQKTEEIVNFKIKENLPVRFREMSKAEAEKIGAMSFFKEKYPDPVKVYYIGHDIAFAWSKEFCGGPHVDRTGEVGKVKIIKEEAVSAGVRRIRATAE